MSCRTPGGPASPESYWALLESGGDGVGPLPARWSRELLRRLEVVTGGLTQEGGFTNDIAKYFAILPAIFVATYAAAGESEGPLAKLNVMDLGTPQSAIISAIVFNAIVIPLLVPVALRGVKYRAVGATALLRRNLLIYGLGGLIAPFVGIKLIDLIVHNLLGA